jgi:hypothetical protein
VSDAAVGLDGHLAELESRAALMPAEEQMLWPRTPINDDDMQRIIGGRVGASDQQTGDSRSRPHRIARAVGALTTTGAVPAQPTVLDIACGDALVLLEVKRRVPSAACFGVDLHVGAFAAHRHARAAGVVLRRVLIQDLFAAPPPAPIDVAVMLNTYRGWENADLRKHEEHLPHLADSWFDEAARFVLLTMRGDQVPMWRARGYAALDLGRGEDDSRLTLLTRQPVPSTLRARAAVIRTRHVRPRLRRA